MISFVVPCWNEAALLPTCIKSIRSEINVTGVVGEIIVVDNGSTDDTVEIALALGCTVIHEPRKGVVWARQAGYQAASYELLANIDADNELPFDWLMEVLLAMNRPDVVAISGPVIFRDLSIPAQIGAKLFYYLQRLFHFIGPTLQGGNYMVRRSALKAVGGYDTGISFYGEDTKTAILLAQVGRVKLVPRMWVWSSARRLLSEGVIKTTWTYTLNYFWVSWFGRPLTRKYKDIRPS